MKPIRVALTVLLGALLLLFSGTPMQAQSDARFFPQTGYRVSNDTIWDYFQARGGVATFGYPVSNPFTFQGFTVQLFQRHLLQSIGEQARPVNLLDPGLMPLTHLSGSTFPAYNPAVAAAAPTTQTPNYGEAVRQHLLATVPNTWEGEAVGFLRYFYTAAPASAPGADTLIGLEVWGFPTSAPVRDPANHRFIYQRFQRGIMHFDATTGVTRGILLGDAFKSLLTQENLPRDLAQEFAASPLLGLYAPSQPNALARTAPELAPPITQANTNLSGAFAAVEGAPPPAPPVFTEVDIYLIALDSGGPIGCGDTLVPVSRTVAPTTAPLTTAIRELLSIKERFYGQSGLYHALYRTDLHIDALTLDNGTATLRLVGEYQIGGTCDEPRVTAQIKQTALQFATVDSVILYINGQRMD